MELQSSTTTLSLILQFLTQFSLFSYHSGLRGPSNLFFLLVAFFTEAVLGTHRRQLLLANCRTP